MAIVSMTYSTSPITYVRAVVGVARVRLCVAAQRNVSAFVGMADEVDIVDMVDTIS